MLELPKNEYRISITSACNMKCLYCHNEGNNKITSLSKDDIELLIANSNDIGLKQVRLTGGEPLVHKEIFDICQMLSDKYHLKVGINTNGIELVKLLYMINRGWIHRVVVGIDYYGAAISKQSPIGYPSEQILNNVLAVKNTGCDVNISTVYTGDYDNVKGLATWCMEHNIRLKILEVVKNEICCDTDDKYKEMRKKLIDEFNLDVKLDPLYKEIQGVKNNTNVITFFHSHCRLRECNLCKQMHLRVTSTGKLKECLHYDEDDIDFRVGDVRANVMKVLERSINFHK